MPLHYLKSFGGFPSPFQLIHTQYDTYGILIMALPFLCCSSVLGHPVISTPPIPSTQISPPCLLMFEWAAYSASTTSVQSSRPSCPSMDPTRMSSEPTLSVPMSPSTSLSGAWFLAPLRLPRGIMFVASMLRTVPGPSEPFWLFEWITELLVSIPHYSWHIPGYAVSTRVDQKSKGGLFGEYHGWCWEGSLGYKDTAGTLGLSCSWTSCFKWPFNSQPSNSSSTHKKAVHIFHTR